jgi:hypothetical protein
MRQERTFFLDPTFNALDYYCVIDYSISQNWNYKLIMKFVILVIAFRITHTAGLTRILRNTQLSKFFTSFSRFSLSLNFDWRKMQYIRMPEIVKRVLPFLFTALGLYHTEIPMSIPFC